MKRNSNPMQAQSLAADTTNTMLRANADQSDRHTQYPSRRIFLRGLAGAALLTALPSVSYAHAVVGPVRPPFSLPAVTVTRQDGVQVPLQSILTGKTTALQLMFTGCSQTCPLQGALFAAVQGKLPAQSRDSVQLVSLSIDPLGDDARALATWLKQFNTGRNWIAAVPAVKDLDRLRAALQESKDGLDNHTGQVFLFNRQGMLVWRTEDLPPVDVVVRQLSRIADSK